MKPTAAHPPAPDLNAFALGKLSPAAAETIAEHISECATCRTTVEGASSDGLVELIRSAARAGPDSHMAVTPSFVGDPEHQTEAGGPRASRTLETPPELVDHPRYRIVKVLGGGGMGVVYLAEHKVMKRLVALKVMGHTVAGRSDAVRRFLREIEAVARLDHPNIARAFDADQVGDMTLFVMEYVEGEDLATVVKRRGALPVPQACEFVRQAAVGLQHAFERGIIHRDIKPHNLMLTPEGVVKVLDFGLTRGQEQGPEAELTSEGAVIGTPLYLAPEQANDAHQADTRADIYSLGCTLYYLLSGAPPFRGSLANILLAHQRQAPDSLHARHADVPLELDTVIARMMAKDPTARPQTPLEVAELLLPFTLPLAEPDDTEPEDFSPPAPARRKRRLLKAAAIGLGIGLVAVVVMAAAGMFKIKTKEGTIVLKNLPPDAVVLVDGATATVTWPGGEQAEIRVKAGEPMLEVQLDGVTVFGSKVTLRPNERAPVEVILDIEKENEPIEPKQEVNELAGRQLLKNPGCEEPVQDRRIPGWEMVEGRWHPRAGDKDTPSYEGKKFFSPGPVPRAELAQDVDVSAFAATIDAGKQQFKFIDHVRSYNQANPDQTRVIVEYRDAANVRVLAVYNSGLSENVRSWKRLGDTRLAPVGTRWIRVRLIGIRNAGKDNDGYHDGLSLKAVPLMKEEGFVPLFNGKDLTGWKPVPSLKNQWKVQNGILMAAAEPGAGPTALLTERQNFADFALRVETMRGEGMGGALGIRVADDGLSRRICIAGSELEKGTCTGAVTLPHRFNDPNHLLAAAKPSGLQPGEWYTLEVVVVGDRVTVSVDSREVVDYRDPTVVEKPGAIGLFCRGGATMRFRKVEVKELPPAVEQAFVPLFNRKQLTGWLVEGDREAWQVRDGELAALGVGTHDTSGLGFLLSERDYTDFVLRFQFKQVDRGDATAAVAFRARPGETELDSLPNSRGRPYHMTAWLGVHPKFGRATTGGLLLSANYENGQNAVGPNQLAELRKAGEWNDVEIELRGQSFRMNVNGRDVQKLMLNQHKPPKNPLPGLDRYSGRIGFVKAAGEVRFRNIEIRELK